MGGTTSQAAVKSASSGKNKKDKDHDDDVSEDTVELLIVPEENNHRGVYIVTARRIGSQGKTIVYTSPKSFALQKRTS